MDWGAQRAASWLTGSLEEREVVRARVGEVALLPTSASGAVTVKGPDGEVPTRRTEAGLKVGPLMKPGAYRVFDEAKQSVDALLRR